MSIFISLTFYSFSSASAEAYCITFSEYQVIWCNGLVAIYVCKEIDVVNIMKTQQLKQICTVRSALTECLALSLLPSSCLSVYVGKQVSRSSRRVHEGCCRACEGKPSLGYKWRG